MECLTEGKDVRSAPAHLRDDVADGGALVGVQLGDQIVRGVGDHSAEHASDVSGHERDTQLFCLAALRLWLRHHVLVQRLDCVLKARCAMAIPPVKPPQSKSSRCQV